jgi:hypothetical protein
MDAGFCRQTITPPVGTPMLGFARRDYAGPTTGAHDDLYARVLWVSHDDEAALVVSLDLCLLGRADADRLKQSLNAALGLPAERILIATTHTHAGPALGTCNFAGYQPPNTAYLDQLDEAVLAAARAAREAARPVTMRAGVGRTRVPLSRRRPNADGTIAWAPHPEGAVCDHLPVVTLTDAADRPVAVVFSASCHPSMVSGHEVSAGFPGVACATIDDEFGDAVSMFLQGAAGDAKPAASADDEGRRWRSCDWDTVAEVGRCLAAEVSAVMSGGLDEIEPEVRSALVEVPYALSAPPSREDLERLAGEQPADDATWDVVMRHLWATDQLTRLRDNGALPTAAPILIQALQLGSGLRFVAMEGEPVAELGLYAIDAFGSGVTVPLGYANGQGLYLPVERMLTEGGYEVDSAWEYQWPAPPAEGGERLIDRAVATFRERGLL